MKRRFDDPDGDPFRQILQVTRETHRVVYNELGESPSRASAIRAARAGLQLLDEAIEEFKDREFNFFSCRPGCHYCCCFANMSVTPLELAVVADAIIALPEEQRDSIEARVFAKAERLNGMTRSASR